MPFFKTTRYNETVAVIQQYGGGIALPLAIRNDIVTMIHAEFPRATAAQKVVWNQLAESISVKAHIGVGVARGTAPERQLRRAIALLWAAIGVRGAAGLLPQRTAAMNIAPAALPAAMDEAMFFAAAMASNNGITHVFSNHFAANPLAFIQQHRILIQGSTAGQHLLTGPAGAYQNVLAFNFYYVPANHRFQVSVGLPAAAVPRHAFNAVSVTALHWALVPGRGPVAVPPVPPPPPPLAPPPPPPPSFAAMQGIEFGGANWMMTTQLTGCAFCLAQQGGVIYASHITPAPGLTGLQLANQLMGLTPPVGAAVMSNHPAPALAPVGVFGSGAGNFPVVGGNPYYPAVGTYQSMSIFGQVVLGGWQIFAQVVLPGGAISLAETRRIL
jgi:hypothetical protein